MMHNLRTILAIVIGALFLQGCSESHLLDTNVSVSENNWVYAKSLKESVEIKDAGKSYELYFKLRHTAAYRYSNLYVLVHLRGSGLKKDLRYQFKLAKPDGEWIGNGSGDIYSLNFPLLKDYRFARPGKYEIEIEQNMRDNPLAGISDIGILLREKQP